MESIKKYLKSVKGQTLIYSFLFCTVGMVFLTLLVGSIRQSTTMLFANAPIFGFVWGISNRMIPLGLGVSAFVISMELGRKLWIKRKYQKEIILGGFIFSVIGIILSFLGF